ncbi:FAD-binding protein [Litorilituus lipolyticus]|uniref:FAD-binding protein n=1 Tax=Litorilituus lipolyticus TaxID=2491017 RepID=A0A502L4D8_9GAMM|nr:FAD-binding protein [Litorilituus lipolyticus]TPH17769.1 FAD-binding protein [Litorilituus lipolyticus]
MSAKILSTIEETLSNSTIISSDESILNIYLQGTEGLNQLDGKQRNIIAVVKVAKATEIQLLLNLANQFSHQPSLKFTIYPISTGNNWGYGTSQPASIENNVVLLDLSALTNISHFDETLGLVTLEPGVTQQQLSDYLRQNNHDYMVPVTGAGPNCSILANALERGYGITPYTDHFGAVTSIHGYWADGRPFHSAICELDQSTEKFADKTFKWGLGPYLDGLFTQSNFAIATQMTIRLAKLKPAFVSFFIQIEDDALLEEVVPLIRQTLQDYEGIVGSINLLDQRRLLSMFAKNPHGCEQHNLSLEEVKHLAKKQQAPCWTVVGSIYGSKGVVKVVQQEVDSIFKKMPCKRVYSNSLQITLPKKLISIIPRWLVKRIAILSMAAEQLDSFDKGKEIMLGKPNTVALKLAYWRHNQAASFDKKNLSPSEDNCGLLWYAPLITMKAKNMREFINFVRETCPKYNIEPFITFTNLRHDCVDSTIPIVFDLNNPQAVKDAHACLKELVIAGLKKGFVPYRLNIDQQQWLLDKESDFWQTVNQLKAAIDPNDILSLGRYNPR